MTLENSDNPSASTQPTVLNEHEAATYIHMSTSYLRKQRWKGTQPDRASGPPYIRIGRSIRYRRQDLDDWMERNRAG